MRPQGGAEPGIEDVGVALEWILWTQGVFPQVLQAAYQPALIHFIESPADIGAIAERLPELCLGTARVPDGNAVAPPQLPADAPVAFLAQPIEVCLRVTGGEDFRAAVVHCVHGDPGQARPAVRMVAHAHE